MRPVFIHVSKNGGSSIVGSAGEHIVSAGHRTAASWVAEHGRGAPLFAVVRHPYDRVASEYAYRRVRLDLGEQNPHLANLVQPFDDWVRSTYAGDEFRTRAFFERTGVPFTADNMVDDVLVWFIPQTRWLGDGAGNLLVDEVLRFEHLDRDWRAFCARQGFACELAHVNASPGSAELRAGMSPRAKRVIADYFETDFEMFGYGR